MTISGQPHEEGGGGVGVSRKYARCLLTTKQLRCLATPKNFQLQTYNLITCISLGAWTQRPCIERISQWLLHHVRRICYVRTAESKHSRGNNPWLLKDYKYQHRIFVVTNHQNVEAGTRICYHKLIFACKNESELRVIWLILKISRGLLSYSVLCLHILITLRGGVWG